MNIKRMCLSTATAGALSLGVLVAPAGADIINVPGDHPTIQAGVDAAFAGDEVVIADGTYTGAGNVNVDFGGKIVTVRSASGAGSCTIDCQNTARAFSFTSGETPAAVVEGLTITNGEVVGDSGGAIICAASSPTIRGCVFLDNTAYTVEGAFPTGSGGAIASVGGGAPVIEGCLFDGNTAGFANSAIGTGFGGAVFMFLGGGTVTDCRFDGNVADGPGGFGNGIGGGVFALFANPSFAGCTFDGNRAVIAGGGVWLQGTATTTIGDCTFDGNTAQSGGGLAVFEGAATVHGSSFTNNSVASDDPLVQQQIGGGAIGCADTVTITISDCFFSGNTSADGVGGAVSSIGGSTATIERCEFIGNSAGTDGGAVHNGAAPGSEDPDLELPSTMSLTGCLMACSSADRVGGGVSNRHGSTMSMTNCTVGHNDAHDGGGLANMDMGSAADVVNGILWGNHADAGPRGAQILDGPGGATVGWSIVQRGWAGTDNLARNPRWVDATEEQCPDGNDYHLSRKSPAIGAGEDGVDMGAFPF